jgi:hypothetical protein
VVGKSWSANGEVPSEFILKRTSSGKQKGSFLLVRKTFIFRSWTRVSAWILAKIIFPKESLDCFGRDIAFGLLIRTSCLELFFDQSQE